MRKNRRMIFVGSCLLLLFVAVSILTFRYSSEMIEQGYLSSEGSAAKDFAVLTAANIHLTDQRVKELKACSYAELKASDENEALRKMMNNESFAGRVDYAYVMIHLSESEVRYRVTEENSAAYNAPLGTPLEIMWLLDVNVSPESAETLEGLGLSELDDIQRYSYYIEQDSVIFSKAPTSLFNSSEWGDHICGYAPLYSVEGTYIGVVGVELKTSDFDMYRNAAMEAQIILLAASTLTLTLLFVYLYLEYRKLQFEKIYTDSLTGICNRSYYNDQFIRRMNAKLRAPGDVFGLMISDVDLFKRVNDTFGHEVGDEVLQDIAKLLLDNFGKEHVVRFGGEEFVIGLWAKDEEALKKRIDTLFDAIRCHKFSRMELEVTLSLGCSWCKTNELNGWLMSGMLRTADLGLYDAKEHGRDRYRITHYDENAG